MRVFPFGRPNRRKGGQDPYLWCQHCGLYKPLKPGDIVGAPIPSSDSLSLSCDKLREPLDESIARRWHESVRREFFHSRGISDEWIDRLNLGYAATWIGGQYDGKPLRRYSIPAYEDGKLLAISLRIPPERENRMKARGVPCNRYISYPGSQPALFNSNVLDYFDSSYVLLDESPLDAAALCSHGYPAMAVMGLNNPHKAWERRWNRYVRGKEVIVIAQRDEHADGTWPSLEIATLRAKDIPGAWVLVVPPGEPYKKVDTGDMIRSGRLAEWIGLPKGVRK